MSATSVSHGVGTWGLSAAETGMILETINFQYTHEKGEIYDLTGNTSGVTYYDEKIEISLDGEITNFSTALGESITILNTIPSLIRAGVSGGSTFLEDVQVSHARRDYRKISAKATYYPNIV